MQQTVNVFLLHDIGDAKRYVGLIGKIWGRKFIDVYYTQGNHVHLR